MLLKRNEWTGGIYFTGLILVITGLPLSMSMMSIGQMVLAGSWLISGNLGRKLRSFFSNPVTLVLSAVFLLHVAGLAWSDNMAYGLKDIRIKIPLLLLPLIISGSAPLSEKKIRALFLLFVLAVFAGTLCSMAVLTGLLNRQIHDIRDISLFISHIRFGLMIAMAVFICSWLLLQDEIKKNTGLTFFLLLLTVWFLVFMVILEAVTGLVVLWVAIVALGVWMIVKRPAGKLKLLLVFPLLLAGILIYEVNKISSIVTISDKTDFTRLEKVSPRGHPYVQETPYDDTENGNPIWVYICPQEIDSVWPLRSKQNIHGQDGKGQGLYFTLIRYLSSKGLRKDADGIRSLSETDIKAIEDGYTNFRFTKTSNLYARLYQIVWEYHHYRKHGKPEGHSVMQRFEFWKTGWRIFLGHPLAGVGTGDVQDAFDLQYEKQQSSLPKEFRYRAHNQYLTMALTFGVPGFLLFLFSLFYPWIGIGLKSGKLYSLFLMMVMLSFFNEDTLETQAGATFFAFFNALLLFGRQAPVPGPVRK